MQLRQIVSEDTAGSVARVVALGELSRAAIGAETEQRRRSRRVGAAGVVVRHGRQLPSQLGRGLGGSRH